MTLDDFKGEYLLTGAETHDIGAKGYGEQASAISFILNGVTYTAEEDPQDGYRSCLGEISTGVHVVKNIFPGCRVKVEKGTGNDDTVKFVDVYSGKTVIEVGTNNTDDYYPNFVSCFMPENMVQESSRKLRDMVRKAVKA